MLFAVKNRLLPTLLLLVIFVAGASAARAALGLQWDFDLRVADVLLGIVVIAVSDSVLHALLAVTLRERYLIRYRSLVEYFRPQRLPQIVAGSLLAGGEEMLFRGVLLEGLRSALGWSPAEAIGGSAVVFGLLHAIPRRDLVPFAVWAVWEGVLLGLAYTMSGSLLASILVHVLHDFAGFSLFAWQRRLHASRAQSSDSGQTMR